jgi:hypothetical protein
VFVAIPGIQAATARAVRAEAALTCSASADPSAGNPPLDVQLSGRASDGTPPYAFSWDFDDGSPLDSNRDPRHTFSTIGTYEVTLTVTDDAGATAQCAATVRVTDLTCVALAAPDVGEAPLEVRFGAYATGGTPPYAYSWYFMDGTGNDTGLQVDHTFDNPGVFDVMMLVKDSDDVRCARMLPVTVISPPCFSIGDADGDRICDDLDDCASAYNPDQLDVDSDRLGDVCDNCGGTYNAGQLDADDDASGDACDNCPATYNPAQDDLDVDGAGDACDLTVTEPAEAQVIACDPSAGPSLFLVSWLPGPYDRFRAVITWTSGNGAEKKMTSGDRLLKDTSWTPPSKKWRKACAGASTSDGVMRVQVFGKSRSTRQTGFSEVVTIQLE